MEKHCKNTKCQRALPSGYKYKFCENCRNERAKRIKDAGKLGGGLGALALMIIAKTKK